MTALPHTQLIEVKLQTLNQLFNSMDPSPFHERDLDHDAEQFIVSWTQEHHIRTPLKLVIHLSRTPDNPNPAQLVSESVHHYFAYKAELNRHEFRQLMREGWMSLLIGLGFLGACVASAQAFAPHFSQWSALFKEGFTIIGWVAMWRPLEIYLYRWWPVRRLGRIFRKLSAMPVEVRTAQA